MKKTNKNKVFCLIYIIAVFALALLLCACNNDDASKNPSSDNTPTVSTEAPPTEAPATETATEGASEAITQTPSEAISEVMSEQSTENMTETSSEAITEKPENTHIHTEQIIPSTPASCTSTGTTEGKICSECGEILVACEIVEALPHTPEIIPAVSPTCTKDGSSEGVKCRFCGIVAIQSKPIAATGHIEEYISGILPTCTNAGITSGKKCTICDAVIEKQTVIEPTGHTEKYIEGSAPTCTQAGTTGSMVCSVCDNILEASTVISPLGHKWNEAYSFDSDSHWQTCQVCTETTQKITHDYNQNNICTACGHGCEHKNTYWVSVSPSTCSKKGLDAQKCPSCTATISTRELDTLPHTKGAAATCTDAQTCLECKQIIATPLGHTSGAEATCTTPQVCTACNKILAQSKGHTAGEPATCTSAQKCTVCNDILVEARGHSKGAEATCTTPQLCTVCSYQFEAARGHTPGTPATCTRAQRCTVCLRILVVAKGHTYNIDAVTCTEDKFCTICNKVIERSAGHTPGPEATCTSPQLCSVCSCQIAPVKDHTPGTPATCTTPQTCAFCNQVIATALGHIAVTDPKVDATCTTEGMSEGRHCSRCSTVLIQQTSIPIKGHDYVYSRCKACGNMISPDTVEKAIMPRLDINTSGAPINSKEIYTTSTVTLSGCDEEFAFSDISAGIRIRGNSTAVVAKKPYRLKFDVKRNMLGLNNGKKFKSWVLMADYYDSSMLRTFSTFSMAKILNEGLYFSSDFTPVEVYINGEYQGVYLLCEQSQIDGNRVDIYERDDTDTSLEIGYLLIGQGGRTDEPNTVSISTSLTATDRYGVTMSAGGGNFSISGGDYTSEQIAYVKKYVEAVYEVIRCAVYEKRYYSLDRQGNFIEKTQFVGTTDEEKQIETIDGVFNIDACVRLCILDEIVKNLDAGTYNMYVDLSPTGDGRLTLGPPWDFDFAMANTGYSSTHSVRDFYATNYTYSDGMRVNTTFVFFGNLPWFEDMIRDVWAEHVDELYAVSNNVRVMTAMYGDQYQRDYAYWNRGLMGHHCYTCHAGFTCHYDTSEFLADWLVARIDWLDWAWGDGELPPAAEQSPLMLFDGTDQSIMDYLTGFKRCQASVTTSGLRVEVTDAHDPYFTLDVSRLPDLFEAQDYPIIEIEFMMPVSNSNIQGNMLEIFLCAGKTQYATAGISVIQNHSSPDGAYHTVRFDLTNSPLWSGNIHNIRIDFVSTCAVGDVMYIKSIKFLTQ